MDEGVVEDVGPVSGAEVIRVQGKEIDFSPDIRKVSGQKERVILREGGYTRTPVQQFVAMFGGNDPGSSVDVESSQNPCTIYAENAEGRVHELTLGHYNADISTMNDGNMMESIMNEFQPANEPGFGSEVDNLHKYPADTMRGSTSSAAEDWRLQDHEAGQPSDHNANLNSHQSTYNLSSVALQNTLPTGGMRMKVISKSSEYPEYFIKNTLMGKGVLYRVPISNGADRTPETIRRGVPTTTDPQVNFGGKSIVPSSRGTSGPDLDANQEYSPTTISDSPAYMGEKSEMPSTQAVAVFDSEACREYLNDGVSLRDWIKSRQSKLHKVDSFFIFKQILDLMYSFHSEEKVLVDLSPSSFRLLPSRKIKYCGRLSIRSEIHGSIMHKDVQRLQTLKRPLDQGMSPYFPLGSKHQKYTDNVKYSKMKPQSQLGYGLKAITNDIDANLGGPGIFGYDLEHRSNADSKTQSNSSRLHLPPSSQRRAFSVVNQLEEKWYRSPEQLGTGCTSSSNVYCLGVFLFELLCSFDSMKAHDAAMSDLRHRILPPKFLLENTKEAGFCLWLLHPEPSLRPTARDILQSEVLSEFQAMCGNDESLSIQKDEGESELLLHFLMSMKEQKQEHASRLVDDLSCIEADITEIERMHMLRKSTSLNWSDEDLYVRQTGFFHSENGRPDLISDARHSRFSKNVAQLENAYFSMRSMIQGSENDSVIRADRAILKNQGNWFSGQRDEEPEGSDSRGACFDGLCKYARYSKLEVCGTLRNRDITNSTNVICSLSFDRDEDYFAAAGVAKKIKVFEFQSFYDNTVDIHYPVIEMPNKSKLSCVCWNKYIRNYLASTDYDGFVKLWDASTGQAFSQYSEHAKRAWSVDFSQLDPTKFASGSDDCCVKLWSINEKSCLNTIRNIANVCCVQFSSHSSNLLAFGSADYKIYCYDLRNANVPWCILAGHEKAVSYVKFAGPSTLVSASTDNTLKIWDLNRSSPVGLSDDACSLTLKGHTNEKNFVGLTVADGYIACGSETNEVYTYFKSLPMPITSHKFCSIDPISGKETDDDHGQFVSSVCWKGMSNIVVAANSSGCIKVLQMV